MTPVQVFIKNGEQPEQEHFFEEGLSLMEALQDAHYSKIEGVCGGSMACATCHVHIPNTWNPLLLETDNEKTPEEEDILEMCDNHTDESRLSCQIRLSPELSGIRVLIP